MAPIRPDAGLAISLNVPAPMRAALEALLADVDLSDCIRGALLKQKFEVAFDAVRRARSSSHQPAADLIAAYLEMLLGHNDYADDMLARAANVWDDDPSQRYLGLVRQVNQWLNGRLPPTGTAEDDGVPMQSADGAFTQSFPSLRARLEDFSTYVNFALGELAAHAELSRIAGLRPTYVKHKFRTSTHVYRATLNGTDAAIKVIRFYNGYASPREASEAEILSRLDSAAVPRCLRFAKHPNGVVLATSWLCGTPLARTKGYASTTAAQLRDRLPTRTHWDAWRMRLRAFMADLSRACIVHGDLGFDNILLDGDRIALIDFGLATIASSADEARRQNNASVEVIDQTVAYLLGPHWAAAEKQDQPKEKLMNAAAKLAIVNAPAASREPAAHDSVAAAKLDDLFGGHDPGRILTLAELRQALHQLYAAEAQQFGLTKFYQSYCQIGIDQAFRSSEQRFAFYGLTRHVNKWHSVLDIGCNTGFMSMMLAPFVRRIHGVDATKSLIQIARLTAQFLGHANCQFDCAEFTRFETSERFDVVLDLAAHGWINLPFEAFVAKVDRLLNPGGVFVVESHHLKNSADRDFASRVKLIEAAGYALLDRRSVPETGDNSPREFCVFRKQDAR